MGCEANKYNLLEQMLLDANQEPTDLPLSVLKKITNNFSEDRKIGIGGFAIVYEGKLHNGSVAVKRLSQAIILDEQNFNKEVTNLMRVKPHQNVVRFLGYCADTQQKAQKYSGKLVMADVQQRLLCFEFLPNGSLDNHINNNNVASGGLEWRTYYQIIKGLCQGLYYLHQQNLVHLDLKPANILLDCNMVPKISDFGFSKCFEEKQTRALATKVVGTLGYMAPEFISSGEITIKSDIYSFGILIIEILTGQKRYLHTESVLESWGARFQMSHGDRWLEHARVCAEIGLECTDSDPAKRPTTGQIIVRLDELESTYGFIETNHSAIPLAEAKTQNRTKLQVKPTKKSVDRSSACERQGRWMMMESSGGNDPLLEPGFRFHPTEEELLTFYLRHQLTGTRPVTEHLIPVVDIYGYHPSELQAMASAADMSDMEQWFFFCPRTERELHGGRPARTMPSGYWKAVGSPSYIYSTSPTASNRVIGEKRTMIFYEGRAPTSNKTRWRMNEYKAAAAAAAVADDDLALPALGAPIMLRSEFSVCRVYNSSGTLRSLDRRPLNPPGGGLAVAAQQAVHCSYQHVKQQQLQPEPLPRRAATKTTSHHHQQMVVAVDDGAADNNGRLAEELLTFYLRHQLAGTWPVVEHLIPVVDIYDYHPSDLPGMAGAANVSDMEQWFFFYPRVERVLHSGRPARTTPSGYWKAVGSPSYIFSSSPTASNQVIGEKCTMTFYEGRAPTSNKTRWRMNEYKAAAAAADEDLAPPAPGAPIMLPNEFSVCRVYISSGTLMSLDRRPLNPPGGGLAVAAQQAVHCGYQHVQQQQLQPEPLPPRAATKTTRHHHQQMVVVVDDGAAVSHSPVQGPGPSTKSTSQPKTSVPSVSSSRPKRTSKPNVRITGLEWQL